MKSITIRDSRQRWPETERTLQIGNELIITRDGHPVAKLVSIAEKKANPTRWNIEGHKKRLKKVSGNKQVSLVDKYLQSDREDWQL